MFKSCTQKYCDRSDEKTFRFDFYCDICGKVFSAEPIDFAYSVSAHDTNESKRLCKLLWKQEHAKAFERANYEAAYHFFTCPRCSLCVCDGCVVYKKDSGGDIAPAYCVKCEHRARRIRNDKTQAAVLRQIDSAEKHKPRNSAAKPGKVEKGSGSYG